MLTMLKHCRQSRWLGLMLLAVCIALLACRTKKKSGVTINKGRDGSVTVSGAPLKGAPQDCAAFKACCTLPQLGLACGLTQTAVKGDCAQALKSIRSQIGERGLTAPQGCR